MAIDRPSEAGTFVLGRQAPRNDEPAGRTTSMRLDSSSVRKAGAVGAVMISGIFATLSAQADNWTYPAFQQEPPGFDTETPKNIPITYQPIEKASKPWHICVSHPHM